MDHEKEKKRKYQQRVIDVELGSFTPPVFGTNRGMRKECKLFLSNLADKLSRKNGESYDQSTQLFVGLDLLFTRMLTF